MQELLIEFEKMLDRKLDEKLDQKLDEKLDKKLGELKIELEGKIQELNDKIIETNANLFVVESELNRKFDTLYDAILLDRDKSLERRSKLIQLDKRVNKTELDILVHDKRIFDLEEKLNKVNFNG